MPDTVLVTGGTGFIAQHCVVQLLDAGYHVRTTVRDPTHAQNVVATIRANVADPARVERLAVVGADLNADAGWEEAAAGCAFVLHVASPLPLRMPRHAQDLIAPARDGTLRVLGAAQRAGVRRVVLTSSIAAVAYGRARGRVFTEEDWSDPDGPHIDAYGRSKTLAERAAWEFVDGLGESAGMDLAVINPGLVMGPLLGPRCPTSGEVVRKLLNRSVPGLPDLAYPPADVRDVAAAHVAAMTAPSASGQRFICAIDAVELHEIALLLAAHFGPLGYRVPTRRLPATLLRVAALVDRDLRLVTHEVGRPLRVDASKVLALVPRPRGLAEMTLAMAESMIRWGVVRAPRARR